jgi:hypothetical protein
MDNLTTKKQLPNASTVLVLGILSLVLGCGIGLILGIIGLNLARKDREIYDSNPDMYLGYQNLNAGRIMSIIGICLNGIAILYLIFWVFIFSAIIGTAGGWSHIFN